MLIISKVQQDWSLLPKLQPQFERAITACFLVLWGCLTLFGSPTDLDTPHYQLFAGILPAILCLVASMPGLWGCFFLTKKQTESDAQIRQLKQTIKERNKRITSLEQTVDHRYNELHDIKELIDADKRIPTMIRDELLNLISDIEQDERTKR